ncbi:MAG: AraC family transcriptional regulator [Clostridiales bacterium]|nr:AraC family transcriptional regulator [Clostridiales bacterium]
MNDSNETNITYPEEDDSKKYAIKADYFSRDINIDNMDLSYGTSMPYFHYHDIFEIFYVKRGHKRYILNEEIVDLQPYDMIIIKPNEVHRSVSRNNDEQGRTIICFTYSYFDRYRDIIDKHSLFDCLNNRKLTVPVKYRLNFSKLMNRITSMDNDDLKDELKYTQMQCYIFELLLWLNRISSDSASDEKKNSLIEHVVEYMKNNYKNNITLSDAADEVFVSPSYLSALFRRVVGMNFSVYLQNLRVGEAIERLKNPDKSISQVSSECGFSSPNYFKDVFKQVTGMSPSAYRREMKDEYSPKFKLPDGDPIVSITPK